MKIVYLSPRFAREISKIPEILDKAGERPFMIVDVGIKDKSFFCPLHTIKSSEKWDQPRNWAFLTRVTEKGREYLDFRKGFLANYGEAAGRIFIMDDAIYSLVASNKQAWKSMARDRVYNPGNIVDQRSVRLDAFESELEKGRSGFRGRGDK